MQLVLSNNRVLAHGENFISMGGTVINTETNKVYQNATVAECSGCPSDIGVVGYEYHAGEFVPCAPFGKGPGNVAVYCDDCKTPRDSGIHIDVVCGTSSYLAFVGNVNTDTVDAAFGKNNEDSIKGVGCALAMYAKYQDATIVLAESFPNLIACQSLSEIRTNANAIKEYVANSHLESFINGSDYAFNELWIEKLSGAAEAHSGSTGGTTNVEDRESISLVVTDEHIAGTKVFYLFYDLSRNYSNNECRINLNGYEVVSLGAADNSFLESKSGQRILKLSDFGITEPGEYTVLLYAHSVHMGDDAEASVTIYDQKEGN